MDRSSLLTDGDLDDLHTFINQLGATATVVDFDEQIQLASVRENLRIWRQNGQVIGFAFLDEYNNLWFDRLPDLSIQSQLEAGMIAWGLRVLAWRNRVSGASSTLDSVCQATDLDRIQLLTRQGFQQQAVRSLQYLRDLAEPIPACPTQKGFALRPVIGLSEVPALVGLHRAAFGTELMTAEARLAMMGARSYCPELDLVAVAPDGRLAGFCVGGIDPDDSASGATDPVGVHPDFRRMGLAKALLTSCLLLLKQAEAATASLGTSSDNLAMRRLAESLGYRLSAEKLWFSRAV